MIISNDKIARLLAVFRKTQKNITKITVGIEQNFGHLGFKGKTF